MKFNRELVKGSIVLLAAFGVFNAMNFVYHFSMARILSLENYGKLAALFSIIYILTILTEAVQVVITKYTANAKNEGKVKNILKRSLAKGALLALSLTLVYALASLALYKKLKIELSLMLLNGAFIFFAILSPITRGVLQGQKRFFSLGTNMALEGVLKVLLGIALVFAGLQVYGAIGGVIFAALLAFAFSFAQLKNVLRAKEKRARVSDIYSYSLSALVALFAILTFFSLDVIIAKAIFPPQTAGAYSIASILSKIIFWGTAPIGKAMFPLTSNENSKKEKRKTLLNAFAFVLVCSLAALIAFSLLPGFIVKIFSGKSLPGASQILPLLGISMTLLSLTNLYLLYKLSQGKVKGVFFLPFLLIIQIVLLYNPAHTLASYAKSAAFSSALFAIGTLALVKISSRN
ncbi:hypothetical protein D6817_01540 [Candidatus Pacearchaeota archaeon]|nr:MAG: hypothetical protein D6817_01540 [Candidatus Pacearchaeota archaeon]